MRRQDFGIKQNFIHDSSLSVLQWSRQNSVQKGGDIQQKCTHKKLKKNFEKIYKKICTKI